MSTSKGIWSRHDFVCGPDTAVMQAAQPISAMLSFDRPFQLAYGRMLANASHDYSLD
jgi:hypothetical protein